ncbi:hypothetical protein D9K79_17915 [Acinetobacter cumulans]|uniref:Uncharacterized protein n=6 Tax=Acinetobacter TaxID=469 RepID=A0A385H7T4_ACILW|nr:hypothetical protein BEN71_00520 [Acinetobacter wuhouensis]AXX83652.1 hypothetical protein ABWEK_J0011 [Acinetobacter lwoffii]AYA66957.1 hypothetical protein CDG62_00550 [Acinetobacter sp. WCHA55]OTG76014.1 hypothetical protein B9T33_16205 [Acinetobacter sp. ANC 5054]PJI31359.1 hypothetical protein CU320_14520 [Acinetobacter pseudolwoffii]PZM18814.1 hypothetical protein DOL94_02005 [Acinetobacter baumannii]RKG29147.1 hypothetical protein D7V32_16340 [Acinetobacter tianfuensis]RKG32494.1 h
MVLAKARTLLKLVSLASWGAVFCIYDQGFKKQNMNNAFAMLMLFDEQKHQYFARRHSLITVPSNSIKNGFSEGE